MDTEAFYEELCRINTQNPLIPNRGVQDINEHLPTLRKYSEQSAHVTEMGTRFGISVYSLLLGKPKKVITIDLNRQFFAPYEEHINAFAKACGVDFEFIEGDVLEMDIEPTDLLFIDTLHTYAQLASELGKHAHNVKRWIVLHDTVTYGQKDELLYEGAKVSDEIIADRERQGITGKVSRWLNLNKQGLMPAVEDFVAQDSQWKIKEVFENNNGLTVLERQS